MKKYVQLKDGVVFSTLTTTNEIETNENIVEVQEESVDYLINKKFENGSFVTIPKIKYAIIENSRVQGFEETYFSSEVTGPIIDNNQVKTNWYYDGSNLVEFSPQDLIDRETMVEYKP